MKCNLLVFFLVVSFFLNGCVTLGDRLVNKLSSGDLERVSPDDEFDRFYNSLFIVDLHADTLLWKRNSTKHLNHGHLDFPRLKESNVGLQVFTIVTRYPLASKVNDLDCHKEDGLDAVGFIEMEPNLTKRAMIQINDFNELVESITRQATSPEGDGIELIPIRSAEDLAQLIKKRKSGNKSIGAILGFEGLQVLGYENNYLDVFHNFYSQGIRLASLTHHFDNRFAGSNTGCQRYGLTQDGYALLQEMLSHQMIIDLAHASPKTIIDVQQAMRMASESLPKAVLVSHTGIQSLCPNSRNLSIEDIQMIIKSNGVIGVIYSDEIICARGEQRKDVFNQIIATFNKLHEILSDPSFSTDFVNKQYNPADYIALGSDFDGATTTPFDVTGIKQLIYALRQQMDHTGKRRFTDDDLRKIAGANACRVLAEGLPGGNKENASKVCQSFLSIK